MTQDDFENFLKDISDCFVTGDFDQWAGIVLLPLSLITKDGLVVLTTRDELRVNFEHYLTAAKIMRLDTVSRRPISLEDCGDGTFIATYQTELMSGGVRAEKPYVSSALLRTLDGRIRMMSIMNARGHHNWTGVTPDQS